MKQLWLTEGLELTSHQLEWVPSAQGKQNSRRLLALGTQNVRGTDFLPKSGHVLSLPCDKTGGWGSSVSVITAEKGCREAGFKMKPQLGFPSQWLSLRKPSLICCSRAPLDALIGNLSSLQHLPPRDCRKSISHCFAWKFLDSMVYVQASFTQLYAAALACLLGS